MCHTESNFLRCVTLKRIQIWNKQYRTVFYLFFRSSNFNPFQFTNTSSLSEWHFMWKDELQHLMYFYIFFALYALSFRYAFISGHGSCLYLLRILLHVYSRNDLFFCSSFLHRRSTWLGLFPSDFACWLQSHGHVKSSSVLLLATTMTMPTVWMQSAVYTRI